MKILTLTSMSDSILKRWVRVRKIISPPITKNIKPANAWAKVTKTSLPKIL